jgi:hypothetical protein
MNGLHQGQGSWIESHEDRIYGEPTAGTKFQNKVQGGNYIWRAYSKDKVLNTNSKEDRLYGGITARTRS